MYGGLRKHLTLINLTYKQLKNSLLWVSDFYDWPLAGIIKLDHILYWFKRTDSGYELTGETDEEDGPISQEYRIFSIYDCPAEWWKLVLERYRDFEEMVGEHWSYENGMRKTNFISKGTAGQFYNKYKDRKRPDLNDSWVAGKCDSRCQN